MVNSTWPTGTSQVTIWDCLKVMIMLKTVFICLQIVLIQQKMGENLYDIFAWYGFFMYILTTSSWFLYYLTIVCCLRRIATGLSRYILFQTNIFHWVPSFWRTIVHARCGVCFSLPTFWHAQHWIYFIRQVVHSLLVFQILYLEWLQAVLCANSCQLTSSELHSYKIFQVL